MWNRVKLLLNIVGVAGISVSVCRADPTEGGDPLPEHAINRLGSTRLYQPSVRRLLFAPGGKALAATSTYDGSAHVRLWDVATGREVRHWSIAIKGGGPMPLAFSADGRYLAAGVHDKGLRVWDTATDKEILSMATGTLSEVVFAPDGKAFAILGNAGVRICAFPSGEIRYEQAAARTGLLAYSGDGRELVLAAFDDPEGKVTVVRRWDTATYAEQEARRIPPADRPIGKLTSDGELLIATDAWVSNAKGPIRVRRWRTSSGQELAPLEGTGNFFAVLAVAGGGNRVAGTTSSGRLHVWDSATGKLLREFDGQVGLVQRLALSTDGKTLAATADPDDAIHIFDVTSGKELHQFNGHRTEPLAVAFTTDGSVLSTNLENSFSYPPRPAKRWSLRRWDLKTGKETTVIERQPPTTVRFVAFSPGGSLVAVVEHATGRMRIYNTDTGKERCSGQLPMSKFTVRTPAKATVYPGVSVNHLVFAPDGKTVAATSPGAIGVWETATGKLVQEVALPEGPARFCFMPDGKSVLVSQWQTAGRNQFVLTQIDLATGGTVRKFGTPNQLAWVDVSADGRLAAAIYGREMRVWDIGTGNEIWNVPVNQFFRTIAFAPNGKLLAAGGRDGIVHLWDVGSGKHVRELAGHKIGVSSLAWSPDSGLLVSAAGNVALVWDVTSITK